MKKLHIAGLAGLASLGAHAQLAPPSDLQRSLDPVVVTASRASNPTTTMRDAIVITREDLDAAGPVSLAEVLQRRAGIELRATGGPGQPQTLFIRGAGSAQTLVLVDGMRVGSATVGTTSIEHIPIEMIERIEVVKGPLSSLYGAEAIGGVVQIFTRGKGVPHFFAATSYGSDNDRRVSAGLATADETNKVSLAAGVRSVDARSASNPRSPFYNADRDPYDNAFFNVRASHRLWQGETLELEAFTTRSRTHFDAGPGDDRNTQAISGAKVSSSSQLFPGWVSRLTLGEGRDRYALRGDFASSIETQQDQAAWINEFPSPLGVIVTGIEFLRQRVVSDDTANPFTKTRRDTKSEFLGVNEAYEGHRFEASVRHDDDDSFGQRTTGSVSYGLDWPKVLRVAGTYARGFRAPTFFDLYGPTLSDPTFGPYYKPNPDLQPERSRSYELAVKSDPVATVQWRLTAFDNRFDNLIVFSAVDLMQVNVAKARARGVEASLEGRFYETRIRAALTAQHTRDEKSDKRLRGRAERYGTIDVTRDFGSWTAGLAVVASGPRFDSIDEDPASRLPSYAVADARLRYTFDKRWSAELSVANLTDRKYENAVGYDAPRRAVMLSLRFESF